MSIKYKNFIKTVALVLVAAFAVTDISYAAPADAVQNLFPPSPLEVLLKDPAQLDVPSEFASLKEVHKGTNGQLIIHIQDAHSNLSGQENLAKALDKIMEKYKVSLVLVEGGTRDDTLTSIKPLASPEVWKKVARQFLSEGKISGEEYLNLTSDHPMKIVGIEDKEAYIQSLKAYAGLAEKREETLNYISKIRSATDKLKLKIYPHEFLRYEKGRGMRDEGRDFEKSIDSLFELASGKDDLSGFPDLQRLKVLREKENGIDFKLANLEQAALIEAIVKSGGENELSLDARNLNSEAQDPAMTSFCHFQKTFRIAKEKRIDLSTYPNYLAYGEYLKEFSNLDHDQVLEEIERLEDKLYISSLTTHDSRQIRCIDRYLKLIDTAHKIQMSAPEFDLFKVNEPDFATQKYLAYLNRQLTERNFFEDIVPYQTYLETGKQALGSFYESVAQRDHEFVKNTERILQEEKQQVAVLITGGYHTPHLKQLFKEKNISYAVLAPRVTCETDQKKYEKILLEPLEKENSGKSVQITIGQDAATARALPAAESGARLTQLVAQAARLAKTNEETVARTMLEMQVDQRPSIKSKTGQVAARLTKAQKIFQFVYPGSGIRRSFSYVGDQGDKIDVEIELEADDPGREMGVRTLRVLALDLNGRRLPTDIFWYIFEKEKIIFIMSFYPEFPQSRIGRG